MPYHLLGKEYLLLDVSITCKLIHNFLLWRKWQVRIQDPANFTIIVMKRFEIWNSTTP